MADSRIPPVLQQDSLDFPDIAEAQRWRDGLVAIGGDLSQDRMLAAYRQGIFPWFDASHPILWWAFPERMVLKTDALHVGRSLRRSLCRCGYYITANYAFDRVVRRCARTFRPGQDGNTWLVPAMQSAYTALHHAGHAHSFEYWYVDEYGCWRLGGGLFGIMLGRMFYGESMFTHVSNAAKITFFHAVRYLRERGVQLIDCQIHSEHMARLGAEMMPFDEFRRCLDQYCSLPLLQPVSREVIAANSPQRRF